MSRGDPKRTTLKDGTGRWRGRCELSHDPATGKRTQTTITARTKEAWFAARDDARAKARRGSSTADSTLTVTDYLTESWLPHKRTTVRPSTAVNYAELVAGRIIPVVGGIRLTKLSALDVARVLRLASEGGLGAGSLGNLLGLLRSALKQAQR